MAPGPARAVEGRGGQRRGGERSGGAETLTSGLGSAQLTSNSQKKQNQNFVSCQTQPTTVSTARGKTSRVKHSSPPSKLAAVGADGPAERGTAQPLSLLQYFRHCPVATAPAAVVPHAGHGPCHLCAHQAHPSLCAQRSHFQGSSSNTQQVHLHTAPCEQASQQRLPTRVTEQVWAETGWPWGRPGLGTGTGGHRGH